MDEEVDWNLIFTNAFRSDSIKSILDKIFHDRKRVKISREEFEQICVQCCSIMMNKKGQRDQ